MRQRLFRAIGLIGLMVVATASVVPHAQAATSTLRAVSAGGFHSCVVETHHEVACWGRNEFGQAAPPREAFASVSTGAYATCGLRTDGDVVCWGRFNEAQARSGHFKSVSVGGTVACGVRTDDHVECWGDNGFGAASPPPGSSSR